MTLGSVIRRSARQFPQKVALVLGNDKITYKDLNERINRLADSLFAMGLKKGDRIAVLLHNCPEFLELYFACAKTGGVFVPINNLLKTGELREIFQYIEPRFLVLDPDYEATIDALRNDLTSTDTFIGLRETGGSFVKPYETLIGQGRPEEPDVAVSDDDIMSIFLTSGTTGLPKGAMRTHRQNFINAMTGAVELSLKHDDRVLLVFPFYHVTFEDNIRNVLMANTIVIRREGSFDPKEVLDILSRERITICQFVPTMVNALLQVEDIEKYDLSHLRLAPYAAAPMPVELLKRAMKRFECGFMQFYGQTETGPLTTILKPEDHILDGSEAEMARLASAGRPVLNTEVRVVDENGVDVKVGHVGEIIVRSEAMTIGYWRLPVETKKILKKGWLYTGDFGRLDEEGYVFIVDRKNDMIISGGKNIYPREIEELLYTHEAISEAAVIGVPDEYWGESVKALVVLTDGIKATEKDIIQFCKDRLASYKKPRSVEFKKELPKSPTGKILKRVIRDHYWKGRNRKV